jgi:hypothetical protein
LLPHRHDADADPEVVFLCKLIGREGSLQKLRIVVASLAAISLEDLKLRAAWD